MCVAAIAWRAHPRWLLVAIGNRDEFHERPAAPLAEWDDGSGIIAGRDLRSGGTWLGVTGAGRFSLITNLRGYGVAEAGKASRGELVTDWLTGALDPASVDLAPYNPFNLFLAAPDRAEFLSNRPHDIRTPLAQGLYGLSNGALDEPWPKTLQLKATLLDWLMSDSDSFDPLFVALRREDLPEAGIHPDQPSDVQREAPDTPVFILDRVYGTRCSTVVAIDHDGNGLIEERSFNPTAANNGRNTIRFRWEL
jgi:uncharacterized protein with NRDE domain